MIITIWMICGLLSPVFLSAQERTLEPDTTVPYIEPVPDTIVSPKDSTLMLVEEQDSEDYTPAVESTSLAHYFLPIDSIGERKWAQVQLQRRLGDSARTALAADKDFWYANYVFKKKEEKKQINLRFWQTDAFRTIMWVIIICCFVAIIVLYLASDRVGLFRRSSHQIAQDETGENDIPEDIFEINYDKEIDKAQAMGNYRLAVRLQFLKLLRTMAEKQIIQYAPARTNFDYLVQLHKSNWYHDFFRLTRHYEYVWYGQFPIDQQQYNQVSNEYRQALEKLRY
ncbi:MAG: DUF4129 domain-containing protein [Sphingobacteriales bacterium]|nr:DUF4129 domain-containing protein [Sphingobacteriales bacterium]